TRPARLVSDLEGEDVTVGIARFGFEAIIRSRHHRSRGSARNGRGAVWHRLRLRFRLGLGLRLWLGFGLRLIGDVVSSSRSTALKPVFPSVSGAVIVASASTENG